MILGLDIGEKRVGTALCSDSAKFAYPHETFQREGGKAEKAILRLISDKKISQLVIGMPLGDTNQWSNQCEKTLQFAERLKKRAPVTLIYIDEYGTSEEAREKLGLSGRKEKKHRQKGLLDAVAASIILQAYLDNPSLGRSADELF